MRRRRHRGRDVHGILVLDKPAGITSNAALQKVKRLFNANKAGHTGSLDPIATGVLPICLGEATKLSGYLLDADKGYEVRMRLGRTTTSGDSEGEVVEERPVPPLDEARIEQALAPFRGEIEQVPPMYSAIKRDGQPLYKLARQGIEVEREPRRVTIHALDLLAFDAETITLRVHCSKGTYVRTLAEEIGERLGCGAHVEALRRTRAGPFTLEGAVTLEALEALRDEGLEALDAILAPLARAVEGWPRVTLSGDMLYYLRQGQALLVPKAPTHGRVAIFGDDEALVGIGHILDDGRVAPKRLFAAG